ncbi:YfgM family protein [Legionella impletisoli]|uniref:Ancillary SecYEG translocon subunit n=1 Tax=Legionella impletisoli TaxID=343510 RepID=A0A917N7Z4_9GAMM|nr:tetratricopeptide repeat protein [Legionella impletisoli]GGI76206.1 membrane protein [Legionella impletisoli]
MSVYMTEEEQIEAIKRWWKRYSNIIIVTISLILLAIAGYKYWSWHQGKKIQQASVAYEHLMVAFSNKDNKKIHSYANQLIKEYNDTVYADAARMTLAKLFVTNGKFKHAEEQLQQVANKSKMPALQQVAKIRLARILLSQAQYDQAINKLEPVIDASYKPVINELRGDIYAATGKYPQAVAAYRKAINESQSQGIGNLFLEMKTNELAAFTHSLNTDEELKQAA